MCILMHVMLMHNMHIDACYACVMCVLMHVMHIHNVHIDACNAYACAY